MMLLPLRIILIRIEVFSYLFNSCSHFHLLHADPSGFILFPLVVHSFDLVISSVGILSIRSRRDSGMIGALEDPMAILQRGYSVTIFLAVVTFGLVKVFRVNCIQTPCGLGYLQGDPL